MPIAIRGCRSTRNLAETPIKRLPETSSQTAGALNRVLEDGLVLVRADGQVGFVTDAAQALLGGPERFEAGFAWLEARLRLGADDAAGPSSEAEGRELHLPEEYGGRVVSVRSLPVADDEDIARIYLLKDQASVDVLENDLRLALQMRRHSARLQQAAHDIKAPLNSLTLNLDLMAQHLKADETEEAEERLELVSAEIRRFKRMLREALSHSQLPGGTILRFDLRRLVRDVVALLRTEAREAGVVVRVESGEQHLPILGVRDHLQQALINLLVNSLEAMPDGGTLELDIDVRDDMAVLRITDSGSGIAPDVMEHLFELRFSTKPEGSGLGLYTARSTIRRLGGELEIADAGGQGCVATVRLPLDLMSGPTRDGAV